MRVVTAVPRNRRFLRLVALFVVVAAIACSDSPEPSAPPPAVPAVGWLSGIVTLLGEDGPIYPTGHVTLYASQRELDSRIPRYGGALQPRNGSTVRVYDFFIGGIVPGDYFVLACWPAVGCGEYRDDNGVLRPVRILPGKIARLNFGI